MKQSIKIIFALVLTIGVISCKKGEVYDPYATLEKEAPILKEYVETTEGLEGAVLHESGIWYKITQEGTQPEDEGFYNYLINENGQFTENPIFNVKYKGKLVASEFIFDESEDYKGTVFGVIDGWTIAFLPKSITDSQGKEYSIGGITQDGLQKGSIIRLVIPSPYAYGNSSRSGIPANSPLDFTIEVKSLESPESTVSAIFELKK